jgi:hypothetical protein
MNEKLKDLAFRAGFVGESMFPILGTCQETALQNFANLIVEECCQAAKTKLLPNLRVHETHQMSYNEGIHSTILAINSNFKK